MQKGLARGKLAAAALLAALVLALTAGDGADAQMTFSDGWGKRSAPQMARRSLAAAAEDAALRSQAPAELADAESALLEARQKEEEREKVDECHRRYLRSVAQLHEQIMQVYGSYERCQAHATVQMPPIKARSLHN